MSEGAYIVADFGKTLAKLTLWSKDGHCLKRATRPNAPQAELPYLSLDINGIQDWLIETLCQFADHPVEAIITVAHGAAIAGIRNNEPAFAPPDYEWPIPPSMSADYSAQRDAFSETGSPDFPLGLNFGRQLHYLDSLFDFGDVTLLPYAQYWAWVLSGVAASEVTSLGCHSDLWSPAERDFSPMAKRRGWATKFAPMAKAGDVLGNIRPELARKTGLSPKVRIHAGLHDSNAALIAARGFAEIDDTDATILSTGTWFVAMRSASDGLGTIRLSNQRDCLINVDVAGNPVPTARFMGGREIETLIEIDTRQVDIKPDQPALLAATGQVVTENAMLLPTFAPGFGPFPQQKGKWINRPDDWFARRAAACLYAALIADTSLSLIGSKGNLLIEGRFAEAQLFVRALASLRPDMAVYTANAHNDVSFGALRIIDPALKPAGQLIRVQPLAVDINAYKQHWETQMEGCK